MRRFRRNRKPRFRFEGPVTLETVDIWPYWSECVALVPLLGC
jgi:hypothetical protein